MQHPPVLRERAAQFSSLLLGGGEGSEARAKGAARLATFQPPPLSYGEFKRLRDALQVSSAEPLLEGGPAAAAAAVEKQQGQQRRLLQGV